MRDRLCRALALLPCAFLLLVLNHTAQAQGILYPRPDVRIQPFYVKNLRVNTLIRDAVAETTVEQTFVNDSSVEQEGTYLYPLPEGASPTAFTMTVGDKTMEPRILSKEEARSIYEGIVRRRRDPALLEYVGRNLVRISVYPIPPRGERVIRMRYSEILKPENGMRKYGYTLSTARFGSKPIGVATVSIQLKTTAALKNVYSPSHDVSIRRPDDRSATASWEGVNDASDRDLTLYYSTSDDDIGLSMITYRSGDRDGYFMLLAAPRVSMPRSRILPKQVVFVLDRTGSMSGEKIKQARKSVLFCLNNLHPEDRFTVITFNESPDILFRKLEPASEENIRKARRFVEDVEANGGTNIDEALRAALTLMKSDPGKQKMLVFMTDGLATVGETNIETILQHVKDLNGTKRLASVESGVRPARLQGERGASEAGANARIFCFGVGYDVNVPFLDRLSDQGRGDADYVKPEEDIEVKVSAFFSKVASPILADLRLAFDGADVYDIYPKTFPDLFKGSQLVITGRFRGNGNGTVRLSGLASGTQESFRMGAGFRESDGRNSFLPRIWAGRKIGYLVDQIRLSNNPESKREVIDEIVRLSRDYGIITEYTSFLVDEREQTRLGLLNRDGQITYDTDNLRVLREEVVRRSRQNGAQGEGATNQSLRAKDFGKLDKSASRYQSAQGGVMGQQGEKGDVKSLAPSSQNFARGGYYGGQGGGLGAGGGRGAGHAGQGPGTDPLFEKDARNAVTMQAVADRTFYRQKNNIWQDQTYDAKKHKLLNVQAFSDAHFALIKAVPSLASYSSVGDEIIVRIGNQAIQIGKNGREKLTAAEIRQLTEK